MVRMIGFAAKLDVPFVDDTATLVADVLAQTGRFLASVTIATQGSSSIAQESDIGQDDAARLATEAIRMPIVVHGFDHAADDKVA